ncbi:ATP-binding protein [Kaarinaea lacus]
MSEYEIHPILERHNATFVSTSNQAVSMLRAEGVAGLRDWLKQANNMQAIDDIYVVNGKRQEVNNKPLPDNIREILNNKHAMQTLADQYQPIKSLLTFKATTPDGSNYLLISTFKHPHVVKYLLAPQRVAFGVVISGLICFLLARYFTSPLAKLRSSTQMLTKGEFDTTAVQQLRKRNDEFGALAEDFEHMSARLRDLLDAQQQLLRDISHELRSPLARIGVALELARNRYKPKNSEEFDRIERELERFELLIRELLTFVKLGPNSPATPATNIDICDLLSHVVDDVEYELKQTNDAKTINLHCFQSVEVKADPHLLHRAVENVVRNACYYSSKNTVINIHCNCNVQNVSITIEDEGPGVPEEMLEKIFQPFVRVSTAREADTGGTGIGLAIAKRVINSFHGTISAVNRPDQRGLVVTITLPIMQEIQNH